MKARKGGRKEAKKEGVILKKMTPSERERRARDKQNRKREKKH